MIYLAESDARGSNPLPPSGSNPSVTKVTPPLNLRGGAVSHQSGGAEGKTKELVNSRPDRLLSLLPRYPWVSLRSTTRLLRKSGLSDQPQNLTEYK